MVVCDNDDDVLFLGEKQQKRRAHKNTGDTYEMMTMTLKKKKRRRRREREGASSSFRIMRHSTRVSFHVFSPCRFHPFFFEINLFFDSSKEIQQKHQASFLSFW